MFTVYWAALCLIAAFGMFIGVVQSDRTTFGINAACFMFDLYMLLRKPGV